MSKKLKESKEKMFSLAQLASDKIYENKKLCQEISFCENQLNLIKEFLLKCSEFEGDESMKKKMIDEGINNIYNSLKSSYLKLKNDKNKISQKMSTYEDEIFGSSEIKDDLDKEKTDNLILISQLKERDYEIYKLKKYLKEIGPNYLFVSDKNEIIVREDIGCYYLDQTSEEFTKKLNKELLYFNFYNSNLTRNNLKKRKLINKIGSYSDFIQILKENIKKGTKIFKEDEQNKILDDYKNIKDKEIETKRQKNKIEILTVSQLFDVNNEEGKAEAIIDYELHSDDEVVFEVKIKQPKKISKDEYLVKIQNQIPHMNFSQIEYNKKKVENDADLYSIKNRKIEVEDIDEKLKEMRKRRKEIYIKCKKNYKKYIAMKNFTKKLKSDYRALRPLKLKTSVMFGMDNIKNNITKGLQEGLTQIDEINEEENENDNDNENENENDNNIKMENFDNNLQNENNLIEEDIAFSQDSYHSDKNRNLSSKNLEIIDSNKIDKKKKKKNKNKKTKSKIKRSKSK